MPHTIVLQTLTEHTRIHDRLRAAVHGSGETFDAAALAAPEWCEFGQWLAQSHHPEVTPQHLAALRAEHTRYHEQLGRVAHAIDQGRLSRAEAMMSVGGEFTYLWAQVQHSLLQLLLPRAALSRQ